MYEKLKVILVDDLFLSADDVLPTASRAEVGLDSLALVELAAALSSRLGVVVQVHELHEAATVADIAHLIVLRLGLAKLEVP